jgi:proteasome lid subunit RPN8/RPN11
MPEAREITYAALITIELPGMRYPATVTVSLRPPDAIEVAPGEVKPLRDCTLAELEAFAEALEADIWEQHGSALLGELAAAESQLKITVLDESGRPLALDKDRVLEHAIILHGEAHQAPSNEEVGTTATERATGDPETGEAAEATQAGEDTGTESTPEPETTEEEPKAVEETEATEAAETPGAASEVKAVPAEQEEEAPATMEQAEPGPSEVKEEAQPVVEDEAAVEEAAEPPAPTPPPAPARPRIAGLRRPLGHPTSAAVDILINETAFRDAQAHALSSLNREVAGMLIGPRPEKQPDGRYVVHVSDIIIAKHTRMHGASVTYTPESWRYVTDKLAERYPNEEAVIVGWYHTHPGFGIFLSGMDLFIHQNFFTQKWHIALVLDPLARTSGFFCWDRGQSEVQAYDFPWPPWARDRW